MEINKTNFSYSNFKFRNYNFRINKLGVRLNHNLRIQRSKNAIMKLRKMLRPICMERKMINLSIQNKKKAKPKNIMKKRLSMEMGMKTKMKTPAPSAY